MGSYIAYESDNVHGSQSILAAIGMFAGCDEGRGREVVESLDGEEYFLGVDLDKPKDPERLIDLGLKFGYIGAYSTFVSPRSFDREAGTATFKQAVDVASDLGAPSVCTLLGDGYYDPPLNILLSLKEAWAQAIGAVFEVSAYAEWNAA